ncbi:MAG: PD-(D/E)XK nuclease family protein [Anaerolineae bacterium]|nr:PD-(D/E)XK nuclease family protein [Anaerolineae bacterium]MDK1081749.1 PD-(D/E)XK nuclease family protein [Anaerolineae bacterium]MDK1118432.1 PD-(D/E)XK nuclease family protein [Anaerolineae bacterium]
MFGSDKVELSDAAKKGDKITLSMLPNNFNFSQSTLQDYADCARRFQLRYLDKLNYPAAEAEPAVENERHLQEGQYFHRLAQQYLLGIPIDKLSRLANTPELQRWWENFLNFAHKELDGFTSLYPEVTLSAPLGKFRLVAKYDLIAVTEDNKLIIFDWKTYRKRPRDEWLSARWQTRVYRALLLEAGSQFTAAKPNKPEHCEMVYWFSNFPDEPARFPYNEKQYKLDWNALLKLTEECQSASAFPLTDDRQKCAYCPYRSYCNRGTQAGDLISIEVEMEAEELFDLNFEQIGEIEF